MMKTYGTDVYNRSVGQVITIENNEPSWDLYWQVAILDQYGDAITYTLVSTPTRGLLGGQAPDLVYTPTLNYSGPDSFSFIVGDGIFTSDSAQVSLQVTLVNDAPVANPQSIHIGQNGSTFLIVSGTDVDGDSLTYRIVVPLVYGSLSEIGLVFLYTPNKGFTGEDSFTFLVSDGQPDSTPAEVKLQVWKNLLFVPVILRKTVIKKVVIHRSTVA